jgi:hypothetical protein
MPRGFVLWLIVMSAIGWGVYQLKYQVQGLEAQLARTNREIVAEQDAIHVLKAEWSYLNQPRQISEMARKFHEVAPIGPRQMVTLTMIPSRTDGAVPVARPEPARKPPALQPAPSAKGPAIVAAPKSAPAQTLLRPAQAILPKDRLSLTHNGAAQ